MCYPDPAAALPTLRVVSLTFVSRLLLFLSQKERWKKFGTSSFLLSKLHTLFWIGILIVWLSGVCATKTKKDFIIIRKKRTMDTITFCYIYVLLLHSSLSSFQYLIHALISHTHTQWQKMLIAYQYSVSPSLSLTESWFHLEMQCVL